MRTISNSGGIWEKGILTKASFPQYVTRYNYRLENLILSSMSTHSTFDSREWLFKKTSVSTDKRSSAKA